MIEMIKEKMLEPLRIYENLDELVNPSIVHNGFIRTITISPLDKKEPGNNQVGNNTILKEINKVGKRTPVFLSPSDCKFILEHSVEIQSRDLSVAKVEEYIRLMDKGMWYLTGQDIIFNSRGQLVNGFHRVFSGSQSKSGFKTYVTTNIPEEFIPYMDTGRPLSPSDLFKMKGYKYYQDIYPIVKFILSWELGEVADQFQRTYKRTHWSNSEIDESYLKHENSIVSTIKISYKARKVIRSGVLNFLGWWMVKFIPNGEFLWDEFITGLALGADLKKGSPTLSLRNLLYENKANRFQKLLYVEISRAFILAVFSFLNNKKTRNFMSDLNKLRENSEGFSDFYERFNSIEATEYLNRTGKYNKTTRFSGETWKNLTGKNTSDVVKAGYL